MELLIAGRVTRFVPSDAEAALMVNELSAHLGAEAHDAQAHTDVLFDVRSCEVLPQESSRERLIASFPADNLRITATPEAMLLRSEQVTVAIATPHGGATAYLKPGTGASHSPARTLATLMLGLCLQLRPAGLFPLHAAGVAHGRMGVIIPGESGAGKTTLVLNLVRSGWHFLSDDALLLEPTGGDICVWPFRHTFGVLPETLSSFPELGGRWPAMASDSRKACVQVRSVFERQALDSAVPRLVIFPEIVDRPRSEIVPLRASEALLRLVSQSALIQVRPDWTREHLALLQRLLEQAPSYRLLAGRDLIEEPTRAATLLEQQLSAVEAATSHA